MKPPSQRGPATDYGTTSHILLFVKATLCRTWCVTRRRGSSSARAIDYIGACFRRLTADRGGWNSTVEMIRSGLSGTARRHHPPGVLPVLVVHRQPVKVYAGSRLDLQKRADGLTQEQKHTLWRRFRATAVPAGGARKAHVKARGCAPRTPADPEREIQCRSRRTSASSSRWRRRSMRIEQSLRPSACRRSASSESVPRAGCVDPVHGAGAGPLVRRGQADQKTR